MRLPNRPTQHGELKELKQLAKDSETVNILHAMVCHDSEEKNGFGVGEIQLFAKRKHSPLCMENPRKGRARPCEKRLNSKRRPEKLRYEATKNRLERLIDLGLVERIQREGKHMKYRVSHRAPLPARKYTLEDQWLFGRVPETFRKMLMKMDYCGGGVRRLHYFPVVGVRKKIPESELGNYPKREREFLKRGLPQYEPGPPIATPKRSQIWMFAPAQPEVPSPWMGDGIAPETGSPIDMYDNFGYFFETFFSKALDEVCPDGWVVLACSRSLWQDTLQKGLDAKTLENIVMDGKIGNVVNELQILIDTDNDVRHFLAPWIQWLGSQGGV